MRAAVAEMRAHAWADYVELTKPRITMLVVCTTLVGFVVAGPHPVSLLALLHTLLGTALVAAGASSMNMAVEWELDARMRRTESRPIPSGRISVLRASGFAAVLSLSGLLYLLAFANALAASLAAVTELLYLFAYTPLKKKTTLCTLVGAVPGAIPPMIGWAGATNRLDYQAWWLFSILFLWQIPHFLSIAWLYRADYARGGFKMLPTADPHGVITSRQILVETSALIIVSLLPSIYGAAGLLYTAGAAGLGVLFLSTGLRLARSKSNRAARMVLVSSVLYLPALLALIVLNGR
jgi:protoheme IX farnesyltransferase